MRSKIVFEECRRSAHRIGPQVGTALARSAVPEDRAVRITDNISKRLDEFRRQEGSLKRQMVK